MIIQGLEFPDKCPKDCIYTDDFYHFGQSATCRYCPILACTPNPPDPEYGFDKEWYLLNPNDFRRDWLEEWYEYFTKGIPPKLEF